MRTRATIAGREAVSTAPPAANPRRLLTERQTFTVTALLDAALAELGEVGFDQLSLRTVAQRAGVTHTTAYSYFTSKSHLIAELHWRQLQQIPAVRLAPAASFADRVRAAFAGPAAAMANEPALAQAVLSAFVTNEPNVLQVRGVIGDELSARLSTALGDQDQPETHVALLTHYSGAMLVAGMLTHDYLGVIDQMESLAKLIDRRS
jgi:AcrR family transcriptional regulator